MIFFSKYSNFSPIRRIVITMQPRIGVRWYMYAEDGEIWRLHLHVT